MKVSTVAKNLYYVGLRQRVVAFVFDFLVVGIYILILLIVGVGINAITNGASLLASPIAMNVLSFVILVLPVVLYFALQECSSQQATWGKRRVNIKVVNAQGAKLRLWQSLLRSAIKFLPWQMAHVSVIYISFGEQSPIFLFGALMAQGLVVIYVICLWLNKRHRTPYDWIAGTNVIAE